MTPSDSLQRVPSRGWRTLATIATLAAWALLAVVIAYWISQVLAPARVHIAPSAPDDPASVLLASGLFNRGASSAQAIDAPPQALPGDARLLGIFAEADNRGYALFRLSSGPKLVAAGQEIAPGATLGAVHPDGIVVREATGDRNIMLRNGAAKAGAPLVAKAGAPSSTKTAACAPPSGFKGQIVALNAELMNGLIAQPDSWRALLEPSNGALVVRDESGFAAMLGLRRGDRIEQANGIALTTPDDVIGAVLRPLASSQPVRVTGSRDGQARELWLRNTTC